VLRQERAAEVGAKTRTVDILVEHRVLQLDTNRLLYIKDWRSRPNVEQDKEEDA
jgi:hypothetical protein